MTRNVATFLHRHASERGDQEAVVHGGRRLTFAELATTVDRAAEALQDLGVARGDRVAYVARNSDTYLVAMLATSAIGAISVPLNTRWADDEVRYALDHATPRLLVLDDACRETGERAAALAATPPTVVAMDGGDDSLARRVERAPGAPVPLADVDDDTPHRILYTSGTTSRPKGAVHTHGGSAANHRAMALDCDLRPGDRSLVAYPFFHVSGLEAPGSYAALSAGVTCIVDNVADAATTLRTLVEERVTCQVMLPPLYDEVVTLVRETGTELPHLRWLLTGGVTPALMDTFVSTFPGKRLIEVFAMTEATGPLTLLDEEHMVEKAGRTGRAVLDVELRVVDEQQQPVPPDTMGVLQARGPKLSTGYWGEGDPGRPDGWFDTGDLATLDADGYLAYRGRAKEMLKSGGENVAMAEIERVLTQHPAIRAACIVRLPDARWGEVPKAYVLLRDGATASADELEAFCRESLAGFKVPKVWQFEDDLPFNHSGKVLRRVLQAREDAALSEAVR